MCSSGMWCQVVWWNGKNWYGKTYRSTRTVTFIRMFKTLVPIYQTPWRHKPEECDVHMPTLLQPMLHFYLHSNGIAKIMFAELWVYPWLCKFCIFTWGQDSPEWLTWYYKINQWLISINTVTDTHTKQKVLQWILT